MRVDALTSSVFFAQSSANLFSNNVVPIKRPLRDPQLCLESFCRPSFYLSSFLPKNILIFNYMNATVISNIRGFFVLEHFPFAVIWSATFNHISEKRLNLITELQNFTTTLTILYLSNARLCAEQHLIQNTDDVLCLFAFWLLFSV